jgi:hypothetical protein
MGDEFLAKTKGFSRTFVIHSNTNPYAAAAAMGMMAARSQEAGPYFRASDSFVPMVDGFAPEELNIDGAPNQIETDFKGDWVRYLRTTGLPACGLKYKNSRTPEENTMRFLNAYNRRIPSLKPRAVHESRELSIPPEYRPDYDRLVALIKAGGNLKPYLSRDILKKKRPDKNDPLLNSWGIQHLHLRSDGTGQLLFCVITESDLFVIQTLHHDAAWVPRRFATTEFTIGNPAAAVWPGSASRHSFWWQANGGRSAEKPPGWTGPRSQLLRTTRKFMYIGTLRRFL